jgi:protein tyrosine phosphatase
MLLFSDPERSVNTSSSRIFRLSMSRQDKESATVAKFFFPGRYSNVTPYSSRSKSQHVSKMQYEAVEMWSIFRTDPEAYNDKS